MFNIAHYFSYFNVVPTKLFIVTLKLFLINAPFSNLQRTHKGNQPSIPEINSHHHMHHILLVLYPICMHFRIFPDSIFHSFQFSPKFLIWVVSVNFCRLDMHRPQWVTQNQSQNCLCLPCFVNQIKTLGKSGTFSWSGHGGETDLTPQRPEG